MAESVDNVAYWAKRATARIQGQILTALAKATLGDLS